MLTLHTVVQSICQALKASFTGYTWWCKCSAWSKVHQYASWVHCLDLTSTQSTQFLGAPELYINGPSTFRGSPKYTK